MSDVYVSGGNPNGKTRIRTWKNGEFKEFIINEKSTCNEAQWCALHHALSVCCENDVIYTSSTVVLAKINHNREDSLEVSTMQYVLKELNLRVNWVSNKMNKAVPKREWVKPVLEEYQQAKEQAIVQQKSVSRIIHLECGCATFQGKPLILDITCKKHHPHHHSSVVTVQNAKHLNQTQTHP